MIFSCGLSVSGHSKNDKNIRNRLGDNKFGNGDC